MFLADFLGEAGGLFKIWCGGLHPQQIGIFREGLAADDAALKRCFRIKTVETFLGALTRQEWTVTLVNVGCDQLGAFGVGAGHDQGWYAGGVSGKTGCVQVGNMLLNWDQSLAAIWPHFFSEASWSSK